MAEDLEVMKQKLYSSYIKAFDDMHLNYLKPIKKDCYTCCAKCAEDETMPTDDFLECTFECYNKTTGANYYISSTLDDFKRRYNTCLGKCDSGVGFNEEDQDDEGDDGEVTAEELKEISFEDEPDPEYLMNNWFKCMDKEDLEFEDEEEQEEKKIDYKDRNTCTRLCIDKYVNLLKQTLSIMQRDLAATALAKSSQASFYYDWSRANSEELPY